MSLVSAGTPAMRVQTCNLIALQSEMAKYARLDTV